MANVKITTVNISLVTWGKKKDTYTLNMKFSVSKEGDDNEDKFEVNLEDKHARIVLMNSYKELVSIIQGHSAQIVADIINTPNPIAEPETEDTNNAF